MMEIISYILPRGCEELLLEALNDAEIGYTLTDKRQQGRPLNVTFNGELYPEQMSAADALLHYDNGVLNAATSFGKTVVGAYLIAARKVSTLVLVHNVEIMARWVEDLGRFLTYNR